MKKIEKLTKEQEENLEIIKNKHLDMFFNYKEPDFDKVRSYINWLYTFSKLKEPITIIVNSPYEAQIAANILKYYFNINQVDDQVRNQLWNQIDDQVRNQVENQVWNQVDDQVRNQVENQVWNQVRNQVENQVRNQVDDQVWNQVWNQVENQVWNQVENQVWNQVWNQVNNQVENQVWNQIKNQVDDQIKNQVGNQVDDQVRNQVDDQVGNQIWNQIKNQVGNQVGNQVFKEYFNFSSYLSYYDIYWLSFYKYMETICKIDNKDYNKYCEVLDLGIYDSLKFENFCIVSKLPTIIKRKVTKLHSNNSPAIEFGDNYKLYFWNGICVSEKLIMTPELITKEDILKETNAEKRRCYMEVLGAKKYYDIISDGKGLNLLDEDIDYQGYPMRLYETTFTDKIASSKVQFLEVTDPSTDRVYNLYPPSQKCKNVWEAKANTFNDEKLFIRQGDVGFIKNGTITNKPLIET